MAWGIGEGAVAVSVAAVIITIVKTKPWNKTENGNGNGKSPCPLHSGIEVAQKYLTDKVDEISEDVKKILGKIGGV